MKTIPQGRRIQPGRDPEKELSGLQRRFGAISRRYERSRARAMMFRRLGARTRTIANAAMLAAVAVAVPFVLLKTLSPWPVGATLRHIVAAPNCDAAHSVGLAPSRKGQPGYWPRHDADDDGVACEPWRYRRSGPIRY